MSKAKAAAGNLRTVLAYATAGALAGVASRTATAPFERLRIIMQVGDIASSPSAPSKARHRQQDQGNQQHGKSVWWRQWVQRWPLSPSADRAAVVPRPPQSFCELFRAEGFAGLFQGNALAIAKVVPNSAVRFAVMEILRRAVLSRQHKPLSPGQRLAIGAAAGAASTFVTYPLDIIRTREALAVGSSNSSKRGILQSLAELRAEQGVRGMFRGVGLAMASVAPFHAVNYLALGAVRELLQPALSRSALGRAVGPSLYGAMASTTAATAMYPLDVLKKTMIVRGDGNATEAARELWRRRGLWGLYRGISLSYVQLVPGAAASWAVYEGSVRLFQSAGFLDNHTPP